MPRDKALVRMSRIEESIFLVRGQKVILDADLAVLYGVETKMLVRAVKRNRERFPPDFMFQLSKLEFHNLRCQSGTSRQWGGRRYAPYAFTEHGAIMAASVLNSERAVKVSIYVVRAFVKLREMLAAHKELALKLDELESRVQGHDEQIVALVETIRQLMEPLPEPPRKRIGFHSD
jgi:phage regulator Rha-like protein